MVAELAPSLPTIPADEEQNDDAATLSMTSSEVTDTTYPSVTESPPLPVSLCESGASNGPGTALEVENHSLDTNATSSLAPPLRVRRNAASVLSDAKTDILVLELNEWVNSNPTGALTRFLRDMRIEVSAVL
jgi:hypothetical protein